MSGTTGRGPDPDDEWARIVAELQDVRRAGDRHLDGARDRSPEQAVFGDAPGDPVPERPVRDGRGPEAVPGAPAADEDEEDAPYSPDPGPVVRGMRRGALLAWTVLVGVPVLLVVLALLPGPLPGWVTGAGLTAVLVAIGHLLRSLPEDRDDLDDGARV
ncbi:hypothetical protein [Kocuria flava]|uniref:Uncharacterized protein n=1 Tax=Kocuria flava TaxID=446860 RepID=A0A2N4T473_9MICC|nr:hypothetical protein [Kocuria flava]PLC13024.1 hypothetical protein AUQ48_13330 [Kocuria flava]